MFLVYRIQCNQDKLKQKPVHQDSSVLDTITYLDKEALKDVTKVTLGNRHQVTLYIQFLKKSKCNTSAQLAAAQTPVNTHLFNEILL